MKYDHLSATGVLLTADLRLVIPDPASLDAELRRGTLVKLRRGAYVDGERWAGSDSRARHILRIHAVIRMATRPVIIAGLSAAAVWGMPVAHPWPEEVTVLDNWKGGGRSEPGVRRTARGYTTALVTTIGGITVTDLARTALDVARDADFVDAIGSVDWACWRKNPAAITQLDLANELQRMNPRTRRRHLEEVILFSTSLSDSFGESSARAWIYVLGFEVPQLQVRITDEFGDIFPDFTWLSVNSHGEFDGKQKYTRNQYTAGDPGEVVWQEKKREDRMRRRSRGVFRILTWHLSHPEQLTILLTEAGIPRRGGR